MLRERSLSAAGLPSRLTLATLGLLVGLAVVATAPRAAATPVAHPELSVEAAWARPAPAGMMSAAYLTIANRGEEDDTLVGATTDVAGVVEVHTTDMQGGVMRMRPAGPLVIGAGSVVNFQPGGLHIMLIDLKSELAAGGEFALTLQFTHSGELKVTATVRAAGG